MCTRRVATSMTNKYVQAPEQDRVHGEEVTRQQALCLGAQEPPPGSIQTTRSWPVAPGAEDPADGRLTDVVAEAGQLAVHPAVSPRRVLPRQPQHQVADLLATPRAAWLVRVGPVAGDQTAATAEYVNWFNSKRLHTAIRGVPPAEFEAAYYAQTQPDPEAGPNT
jgi:hypothetical protein